MHVCVLNRGVLMCDKQNGEHPQTDMDVPRSALPTTVAHPHSKHTPVPL